MTGTIFKDIAWEKLGAIGKKWELIAFPQKPIPTWDSYWSDQRENWGADEPDKKRTQLYFGVENTEEHLLADSKKKYEEFKEYLQYWNDLCKVGEVVQVISRETNVIVLSKNWKGEISDHADLEVWLKEERKLYWRHIRYCCEIYSFGTSVVLKGSVEEQMGEPVGSFRVSNRRGESRDKNETITFNQQERIVCISNARFHIVG